MIQVDLRAFFDGHRAVFAWLVVLSLVVGSGSVWAQADSTASMPTSDSTRPSASSLRTPRASALAYLEACRRGDYEIAAAHLDLSGIPAENRNTRGPELARRLKVVLDEKLWVQTDRLSDRPEGNEEDGLRAESDLVGRIETTKGSIDILIQRVELAEGERGWLFSRSTVENIPALYDEFGYGILGEFLPTAMFEWRLLEVELWQWIGLLLLIVVAYVVSWLLLFFLVRVARPLAAKSETELDDELIEASTAPVRLVVAIAVFAVGAGLLSLSVVARDFLASLEKIAFIAAFTMLLLRVVDILSAFVERRLSARGVASVHSVVPLGRRTTKAILVVFALIALLQNLGVNVSGLVAGLGIGGLALALAAQKTVENLFGGATLITDQPVRVGDFCRFGEKLGVVEDIGLRSTRIRTLDRTVVTVPNAEFSSMQLETFAKRDRIRLHAIIGVRYETSSEQLRHLLINVKRLLVSHPKVLDDPARVRFVEFGSYSLDLEIFAYIGTTDWSEFLAVREDIFLRLIEIVEESGTGFAFPSQTLYLGRDGGLDADATKAAEEAVAGWRKDGALPLPDPSGEMRESMEDSLDYPPRGSVAQE